MLLDYLQRAPAKVIAYDVSFAEADTRSGFEFGGDTWSGQESDAALIDSVRKSGNVIMLSDATYEGDAVGDAPVTPDSGFRLNSPLVAERHVIFPPFTALAGAAAGFGHNLFVLDADGPLRHTVPFVRVGDRALPSLGLAAALRATGVDGAGIRVDEQTLRIGDCTIPAQLRTTRSAEGVRTYQWSLVDFRGPRCCGSEEPTVSQLRVFRSVVFRRANHGRPEAEHRSNGIQGQDRLCRCDRHRAV